MATCIREIRQEVGAMRIEISARLEQVSTSALGLDRRLLDIESTFMNHVHARLDVLQESLYTSHVDIQGLSLDISNAHDDVCAKLDKITVMLCAEMSKSHRTTTTNLADVAQKVITAESNTKRSVQELEAEVKRNGLLVEEKMDHLHQDVENVDKKLDQVQVAMVAALLSTRDMFKAKIDEVHAEVARSRRRMNERLNNVHEALAGIMNNMGDRFGVSLDRLQATIKSIAPVRFQE